MSTHDKFQPEEQFARAVPKNDAEELRVRVMRASGGTVYLDLRQFLSATSSRGAVATFKGLTLPISALDAFLDALLAAQAAVLKRPGGRKR
jgi:hypothetical protein